MILILVPALLCAACATHWTPRLAQPSIVLQWPYQPNKAKATYSHSITGFSKHGGSGDMMRSLVYGRENSAGSSFVLPVAVARGGDGRMAVADMGRMCVHLYIPSQQVYLQLQGPKNERMRSPVGVIFGEDLRLFVSDSSGSVYGFGKDGAFLFRIWKAGDRPLQRPTGLAYSPVRKLLYVVDTLANRVHAFNSAGEIAFSFGERGEAEGQFNFPTHIFRSAAGELYVTNALAFRIEIFDELGQPVGSFGHHGDGSGDLAMPKGLAVDRDGIIYVVDSLFDNVQLFNRRGDFLLTVGRRGVDFGEFWLPSGAFISESGELYVCDTYNRRIQVFRITEGYATNAS